MDDNFQVPPPSYTEFAEKSAPSAAEGRAAMYAAPPAADGRAAMYAAPPLQGQFGEMKYTTGNPTIPVAYAVQMVPATVFAKNPVQCTCANCRSIIVTRTEQTSGILAWISCLILVVFGCWLGCCLIPFCISDLQNVQHYCPNCSAFIGEYRPL